MKQVVLSLTDILGETYINAVCRASDALGLGNFAELRRVADESVDFYPQEFAEENDALVARIAEQLIIPLNDGLDGAGTDSFQHAAKAKMSPLSGRGCIRMGEDGRLYLASKSEHYHASLGHNFPGYELLENARRIGISNITHNNTRGHITRLLERELIRLANGIEIGNEDAVDATLASEDPLVLNRLINLQTGSLAMEAAVKMMLARFYKLDPSFPTPQYTGKIPVFLVMADHAGGRTANYHGTTVLTQIMRDMWPGMYEKMLAAGILRVEPVMINDLDDFRDKVARYDTGNYKIAGFLHELVLMNYGAIALTCDYVAGVHELCRQHDIPVAVDEIQSCMWSPELFLFREYPCTPSFVSVGKGFPGGQYPASKILTTKAMDNLNQFGALVTNGQEELASLSYLITIRYAESNSEHTREIGEYYTARLGELVERYEILEKIEGYGLLAGLKIPNRDILSAFTAKLGGTYCIDISSQAYKTVAPPVALTKLPLVATRKTVDWLVETMDKVLQQF